MKQDDLIVWGGIAIAATMFGWGLFFGFWLGVAVRNLP